MSYFDNQSPYYNPGMLETLVRCLKREDEKNNKEEVLKSLKCIMELTNVLYKELEET